MQSTVCIYSQLTMKQELIQSKRIIFIIITTFIFDPPNLEQLVTSLTSMHTKTRHTIGVGQTPIPLCYVFFGRWSSSFSSHPLQAAVRWAGLAMLPAGWQSLARGLRSGCALMNCRHDAGRQPARRTTKRPSGPISVYLCEGEIVKTALTT